MSAARVDEKIAEQVDEAGAAQAAAPGAVLFILPHHDDEVFCAANISHALRAGRRVKLLWATAGGYAPARMRRREGEAVARLLRLRAEDHMSLGLPDAGALDHLDKLGDAVRALLPGVADVYVPAYEGGHPDHDAVNLTAARVCRPAVRVHEFGEYRRQGGAVVVKAPFADAPPFPEAVLDAPALRLRRALAAANRSQLPELAFFAALGGLSGTWAREPARALPAHDYSRPPGDVRPLYELYTRRRFSHFSAAAAAWCG